MADREPLETHLFTIPGNAQELLYSGPDILSSEARTNHLTVLAINGDPIEVAMAAMVQARMILESAAATELSDELSDSLTPASHTSHAQGALSRRTAARVLLTEASKHYKNHYSRNRITSTAKNSGRVLVEPDTAKILDLYDRTEPNDQLPVLMLIEKTRSLVDRKSEEFAVIREADILLRIAFAGEVDIQPVSATPADPMPDPTPSSGHDNRLAG